ncbi:phosphate acyltransferase PlsX [Rickettsiales endosymbiont of Stachyamoeba lipophora]|uniref:phosphate acyltransferase PlsX n=1 Tax=Rickettsiales endosymbiont of Stachyamoeba lipophora TaxID=2486578 RepID=UPI000F64B4BD|nr:phosphate acyltransferase PlsX [Rickettsiales endosymbiont of Stachyamoeba lipophora]AZL16147.1 phosphate acyltransferase PlsX [Rickettsiales endosymbiont of Stachyamoeba lipophora]
MNISTSRQITIALDAMGGDNDPKAIIGGANEFIKEHAPNAKFIFFGDQEKISKELNICPFLAKNCEIFHTTEVVGSNETPSFALRNGKKSSMRLAIDAVKSGQVDAIVSAGNTGALMAMSKIVLRTLVGIDRPAICGIVPTVNKSCVMLDMGANIECAANNLMQFGIMGSAFASVVYNIPNPKVGLLNVGSEDIKGSDAVKQASKLLKELGEDVINFYGFVEGDDIFKSIVDVVVTDGFSGNISLKTAEGTAYLCREFMKRSFSSSIISKLGYLFAKKSIKKTFASLDHRYYNGAMLIGLDGIVVKSHGSSDYVGMCTAIKTAYNLAQNNINSKISNLIEENFTDSILID